MNQMTGGLGELPLAVGPSDQQQEELNQRWNTYHLIEAHLAQAWGIQPPVPPVVIVPQVTVEILRGQNDDQYMETYNALAAWDNFIGETISQVQNIINQLNNEMDDLAVHVESNLKTTTKVEGKKPSAEDIKFTIKVHPRHRYLKLELQKNEQILTRLEARQKSLSRSERLLSRNIELIKSTRDANLGGGGMQRRASPELPPRFT